MWQSLKSAWRNSKVREILNGTVATQDASEPREIERPTVLPNGGEIHFTDDTEAYNADRIEFLPGGMVKAIFKHNYRLEVYPPERIEAVYTYTKHLEDKEWW